MSKMADRLILRLISQDSPGSASTAGTHRRKISKAVGPRDAKVLFGKLWVERGRESFEISPDQQSRIWFHMVPSLRLHSYRLRRVEHWRTGLFCWKNW